MNGSLNIMEQHISDSLGKKITLVDTKAVSGGCINQTSKLTDSQENHWFLKANSTSMIDMFIAESEGLAEITSSQSIRTPKSICYGSTEKFSFLVLEYIQLQPNTNQAKTGELLAQMHNTDGKQFGWVRNNTIGSTAQHNDLHDNWITFWKHQRLLFQLNLAKNNSYPGSAYDSGLKLAENLHVFFSNYQPQASLLHGDLWGGNCACDNNNNPIIFDPAVYYGDRETDIAMTELFGGFSADFYAAYNAQYKLDSGYKVRKKLYNLYHILNHFNLFGGGYASQAESMTHQLLSEI